MTGSALTMGLGIAALFALIGLTVLITGLGLVWATRASTEKAKVAGIQAGGQPRLTTATRVLPLAPRTEPARAQRVLAGS